MKIDGEFDIELSRAEAFRCLTDARLMARCVPGCESIEQLSTSSYRADVVIRIGSFSPRFNLIVEVTNEQAPERIESVTRGEEGSRASILHAANVVSLSESSPGVTKVRYESDILLTGRLAKFALGMMRKKVEALGKEFAERLRTAIAAEGKGKKQVGQG